MFRITLRTSVQTLINQNIIIILGLIVINLLFNIIANVGFKLSTGTSNFRGFLFWQVIGNLAGFITVLTLTGLLKYIPMHIVMPVTMGLTVIGVQIFGSKMMFDEPISLSQWLGTLLVALGIMLIRGK